MRRVKNSINLIIVIGIFEKGFIDFEFGAKNGTQFYSIHMSSIGTQFYLLPIDEI